LQRLELFEIDPGTRRPYGNLEPAPAISDLEKRFQFDAESSGIYILAL
jgi:hypothetical protein